MRARRAGAASARPRLHGCASGQVVQAGEGRAAGARAATTNALAPRRPVARGVVWRARRRSSRSALHRHRSATLVATGPASTRPPAKQAASASTKPSWAIRGMVSVFVALSVKLMDTSMIVVSHNVALASVTRVSLFGPAAGSQRQPGYRQRVRPEPQCPSVCGIRPNTLAGPLGTWAPASPPRASSAHSRRRLLDTRPDPFIQARLCAPLSCCMHGARMQRSYLHRKVTPFRTTAAPNWAIACQQHAVSRRPRQRHWGAGARRRRPACQPRGLLSAGHRPPKPRARAAADR